MVARIAGSAGWVLAEETAGGNNRDHMDPWESIKRAAADKRSGASDIAARALPAIAALESERDVLRAARRLLRAHPAMAPLWQAFATALAGGDVVEIAEHIEAETDAVARVVAGWALPRRGARVLTHSWSSTVLQGLLRAGPARITSVTCTASLPGGEGRAFAARLRREGFQARLVADTAVVRECFLATIVLVGADAVTEQAVVNKMGTAGCALAAREAGIPCYVLAGASKLMPHAAWRPDRAPAFEATPLELFDAVIGDGGPMRPAAVRRAAGHIQIPRRLLVVLR